MRKRANTWMRESRWYWVCDRCDARRTENYSPQRWRRTHDMLPKGWQLKTRGPGVICGKCLSAQQQLFT